jgi:hypothetical protein
MALKILCAALLVGVVLTVGSCSSSSGVSGKPEVYPFIIGTIDLIGNEPFVKPVLWVDASHLFQLRASKDLQKELVSHQRVRVKLFYSGRQEIGTDHFLEVDHIETLQSK